MPILDEMKKAMIEATRARDQVKADALRLAASAIHYKEIEKKGKLGDTDVIAVLRTLCKQRREAIEQYQKGNRPELAAKEKREMEILEGYLPKGLSRSELEQIARKAIAETGAVGPKDMGKVIKSVMQAAAGRAEGALVSEVVKGLLQ